jgi:protease-4
VYSGLDAKSLGLVDALGGLHEAIELVRNKASVPGFRRLEIRVLPKERTLLDLILSTVDEPFAKAAARARAKHKARRKGSVWRDMVPLALDEALARLPLSVLYLPQHQAHALMPWWPE